MTFAVTIEPLAPTHERRGFACGTPALDRYLRAQAGQDVRRRISNCFVAVEQDTGALAAYYTLAAASIPSTLRSVQPPSATASTAARRAVVNGTESCLKIRKEPSTSGAVVGCLKEGTELSLRPLASGADPKWRQTDQGWVSSEFLKRTQAIVVGTDACLNVRETASSGAAKLGCLPDGTAVTIAEGPSTADGQTWYRIEPAGSVEKSGWVVGKHLD